MAVALTLVAWAPSPVGATPDPPPCNGHTDETAYDCDGGTCQRGDTIGVSVSSDDSDEAAKARGTCNSSEADCAGRGGCRSLASAPAAQGGPWSCSFESVDVWHRPDNGFHYNCYAKPTNLFEVTGIACNAIEDRGIANCAGVIDLGIVEEIIGGGDRALAAQRFADVWQPDARVQRLLEVNAQGVLALECDEAACVPLAPTCEREGTLLRCFL